MRQISGAEALMQFALVLTGTFCILSVVLFLNWMVHHLLHKGNLKTRVTFSLRFSPSQATFSFISIKKKKKKTALQQLYPNFQWENTA